jgi:hypothetical protein
VHLEPVHTFIRLPLPSYSHTLAMGLFLLNRLATY